jgi:phosphoribosylanthranilate isomerase
MNSSQQTIDTLGRPQIKVCGLTRVEEAQICAELGVDAIGCVFFPKSPRHVTREQAREICQAVGRETAMVGVFVNASFAEIMEIVLFCGFNAVQLHGQEPAELVSQLRKENLIVVKALFDGKDPALEMASTYDASACLVECGKGLLPGGNAQTWNWGKARDISEQVPLILAGGLSPDNVVQAIDESLPDAVDVSSGVELQPGQKDLEKVKAFVHAVSQASSNSRKSWRRIYSCRK